MAGQVGLEPTTYGFGIRRSTIRATTLKVFLPIYNNKFETTINQDLVFNSEFILEFYKKSYKEFLNFIKNPQNLLKILHRLKAIKKDSRLGESFLIIQNK